MSKTTEYYTSEEKSAQLAYLATLPTPEEVAAAYADPTTPFPHRWQDQFTSTT